jgi:hypothetical protein
VTWYLKYSLSFIREMGGVGCLDVWESLTFSVWNRLYNIMIFSLINVWESVYYFYLSCWRLVSLCFVLFFIKYYIYYFIFLTYYIYYLNLSWVVFWVHKSTTLSPMRYTSEICLHNRSYLIETGSDHTLNTENSSMFDSS